MTTYYLNGNQITEGSDITLNGYTYPYSWLEGTSSNVRSSLGVETVDDTNFDETYYWSANQPKNLDDTEATDADGNPVYVQRWVQGEDGQGGSMVDTTERLIIRGLKTTLSSNIRTKTNELLKPTDFYIIRNNVDSIEIPTYVSTYRESVILEQERVTSAIAAVTTVEELIEVMSSIAWPETE